jgi:ABC-type branched-subunit amino acid transport system ATPase component
MSLEVRALAKAWGGVRAVDGVSFDLPAGTIAALIGPNGAGKSTLFGLIAGQIAADAGSVRFDDQELLGLAVAERVRHGLGRSFQVARIFDSMTVLQNAQVALAATHGEVWRPLARLASARADEARALLAQAGLESAAARPAAELAYGDLKRLDFALALATRPRLLLMDEPTAGMAPGERRALMSQVVAEARGRGMSVLFTEHSMDVVFGHAERVLVLSRGRLIADGAPEAVRADAAVRQAYLGSAA